MSVKTYLTWLKSRLEAATVSLPITFVTGNQSADLDSVVSAISYAYFKHKKDGGVAVPLLNINRANFRLRKDIEMLLESFSISQSQLYFVEDFDRLFRLSSHKAEVVLVDHCNIQGEELWRQFKEEKIGVTGIVDHHEDEQVFLDASPRIIRKNGSCSSLVFNYWYDQFADKSVFYDDDSEAVLLLLAPLLIDTTNMTWKVEEGDTQAFTKYQDILEKSSQLSKFPSQRFGVTCTSSLGDTSSLLAGYFSSLKTAKKDLKGFSFGDILMKDYKQFSFTDLKSNKVKVGFSSVGKGYSWIFSKYSSEELLTTFLKELNDMKLDLFVVTTSYSLSDKVHKREFSYAHLPENANKPIFDSIATKANESLDLNSDVYNINLFQEGLDSIKKHIDFHLFNQNNTAASRKQVVPVVKKIIEGQ